MRHLLLDVMGTLVEDPFFETMPRFFGMSFERMLEEKHPSAWVEFERGERDEEGFMCDFFADGRDFDHRGLREAVRSGYRFLPGAEELLGDLRDQGLPIFAFSNYPVWYRMIEEKLRLSRFLEWRFVSCKTGLRKPAHEAYRHVLRDLEVGPDACLFVDDRRVNCESSKEVGIEAILFADMSQLREDLVLRELL